VLETMDCDLMTKIGDATHQTWFSRCDVSDTEDRSANIPFGESVEHEGSCELDPGFLRR
jgi:hypothetical protein